jgi:hypothetical protein
LNWKNQLRDLKKHLKDKDPDRYAILKKVSSIVDDEYLLSLTKREVTLQNGQKVIMYHTLAFPPVNEYSWNAGQIKDVPIAALSIPGVNLTAENDTIVRHLHFIVAIADRKKKPQNAYLETILERLTPVHEDAEPSKDGEQDGKKTAEKAADQDEQDGEKKGFSRMERARIAERVTKCLEHFTEINFIKKYEPIQGARGKVTGWTIYPTKKK